MSVLEAMLLGLVQGLTEFLPVSSSGHLAVLERLWKLDPASRLPVTTMLHAGTALALIIFFIPVIVRLLRGLWASEPAQRRASWLMVLYIIVASIPAGIVGVKLGAWMDRTLSSPLLLGLEFIVSGIVLFGTMLPWESRPFGWWRALLVGVAQAIAIVPAISRSGATIATGLYLGMERRTAFEFSFLLAIPAMVGAFALEARKVNFAVVSPVALGSGMAVALVAGLGALFFLRRAVLGRRLHWFGVYCVLAGLATILFVH
jgi:undecaprenyl-diphosphatase